MASQVLTVAVFDADVYDDIFNDLVESNEEGTIASDGKAAICYPFDSETIDRLLTTEPMAPSGAAYLSLALQHRESIPYLHSKEHTYWYAPRRRNVSCVGRRKSMALPRLKCQSRCMTRPLPPRDDLLRLAQAAIFNAHDLLDSARVLLDAGRPRSRMH